MAVTRAWDETVPPGGQFVSLGDDRIREMKQDIRERNKQGGHIWNTADLAEEGRHAVNAGGAGVGPHLYASDGSSLLIDYNSDTEVRLAYTLKYRAPTAGVASKNMHEEVIDDGAIGISATNGYIRAFDPLRVYNSEPVDTHVNIKPGAYIDATSPSAIRLFAGGFLTIGAAPLTLPGAGNHKIYQIYLDSTGALQATGGAEIGIASTPVPPSPPLGLGNNVICQIVVRALSVNFSITSVGENAWLFLDCRMLAFPGIQ